MQELRSALRRHPIAYGTLKLIRDGSVRKAIEGIRISLSREGVVISCNDMGVSNRIKCLLSSMRLAAILHRQIAVFWPRNWACRCDFSDLFENEFFELDKDGVDRLRADSINHRTLLLDTWGSLLYLPSDVAQPNPPPAEASWPVLDFEYENTPAQVKTTYLELAAKLRPNDYIRREVSEFARDFNNKTISVSIRSWVEAKERADGLFDLAHVYARLDDRDGYDFFVSCDSEDILKALVNRYGKRILSYPKRTGTNDRRSRAGMQDILIDMLLLAQNPILIASYLSTYPELAWWLGGGKATVELIEPPERVAEWARRHQRAIYAKLNEDMERILQLVPAAR